MGNRRDRLTGGRKYGNGLASVVLEKHSGAGRADRAAKVFPLPQRIGIERQPFFHERYLTDAPDTRTRCGTRDRELPL